MRQHIFQRMEDRPTGYRRLDEPDDVLGSVTETKIPQNPDLMGLSEEFEVRLLAAVRYTAPKASSPEYKREAERRARQQLHDLLFREVYEQSTVVRRALFEARPYFDYPDGDKAVRKLQTAIDELCDMVSPRNCP